MYIYNYKYEELLNPTYTLGVHLVSAKQTLAYSLQTAGVGGRQTLTLAPSSGNHSKPAALYAMSSGLACTFSQFFRSVEAQKVTDHQTTQTHKCTQQGASGQPKRHQNGSKVQFGKTFHKATFKPTRESPSQGCSHHTHSQKTSSTHDCK